MLETVTYQLEGGYSPTVDGVLSSIWADVDCDRYARACVLSKLGYKYDATNGRLEYMDEVQYRARVGILEEMAKGMVIIKAASGAGDIGEEQYYAVDWDDPDGLIDLMVEVETWLAQARVQFQKIVTR